MKRFITISLFLTQLVAAGCSPDPVVGAAPDVRDVPVTETAVDGSGDAGDAAADTTPDDVMSDAAADAQADAPADAPACPMGQTMCGTECVDTNSSLAHCGACATACAPAGATGACVMGACTVASCNTGRADCNMMAADGCEVELNTAAANCGACGTACTFANAMGACTAGSCGIGTCNMGFGDCDSDPANGCETDLNTTVGSCGMCGRGCTLSNATAGCAAGACTVASCNDGYGNCDMNAANGCETALNSNTNCGGCGMACALGTRCSGGTCVSSCPMGTTFCMDLLICVNTSSDLANCGACGNACPARANSSSTCTGGACGLVCTAGYGDCDMMEANGCETNTQTTATACGACGRACSLAHATAGCAAGACTVARCDAGFGDCDGNPANGCETDLNTTESACGSCGTTCSVPNATPACAAGACAVAACNAGFADCNGMAADGCETPTTTNTNCGACGTVCAAGTRCAGSACVSSCPAGTTFCATTGVCADFQTDASNCGMCGTVCPPLANASPVCQMGSCAVTCNAGFSDCDGMAANGCEVNLGSSVTSCGACGRACAPAHATGACTTGACGIVACEAGWGDCNGDPSDGCETDLTSTASACGVCSTSCRPTNGTGVCAMGRCGIGTCDAGFGNCDGIATNGCETDLETNSNCGACGTRCAAGSFCSGGTCVTSCMTPTSYCGTSMTCVNLTNDTSNCGACGRTCAVPSNATATCATGTCGIACTGSFSNCDASATNGCEVNVATSVTNCGACGTTCTLANATPTCTGGACAVATCNLNFANCDANPANGCEVNTTTSATNCGACNNVCTFTNAAATCTGGNCALGACNTGYGNCNGRASDGCEAALNTTLNCGTCGTRCGMGQVCSGGACVSACAAGTTYCFASGTCAALATDVNNCGTCNNVCPARTNATRTCTAGVCGGTCNTGFGNCDGNAGNGCETNITTSATNCGACGTVCRFANATPTCSAGTCAISACFAGFANCNSNAADGCEANLLTSNTNCGACGRTCGAGTTCRLGTCR